MKHCPKCGYPMKKTSGPKKSLIPAIRIGVKEQRRFPLWKCPNCGFQRLGG